VASLSFVSILLVLRVERSDAERRYRAEIGPLEVARLLPPVSERASMQLAKLRAAADSARTLESLDEEMKRLGAKPLSVWTDSDAELVRDAANTHRSTLVLLWEVEPIPEAASVFDRAALESSRNPSGNTLLLLRLSRLARLTGLEALRRGEEETAVRSTRGLLASAAYLERSPHLVYRMLGAVLEISGMLVLHDAIDRLDADQLRRIEESFAPLRSLPDEGTAGQTESIAFYRAGLERAVPSFLPVDLGRVLWLRCELVFEPIAQLNYSGAASFRDAMLARSDPANAICRRFVAGRVDALAREAAMIRARGLATEAVALRTGSSPRGSSTERERWSLSFFEQRPSSRIDESGAVVLTDSSLAQLPEAVGLGGNVRRSLEILASWRVESPASPVQGLAAPAGTADRESR
jgi:hypothetical protein